jgi:hypothetical protein
MLSAIESLLSHLFGCRHVHCSFPQSPRPSARKSLVAQVTGHWVTCLNCGRELPYDWQQMKIIRSPRAQRAYLRLGQRAARSI